MDTSTRIKVIIADDHQLYRDGLLDLLTQTDTVEVIAEASNGKTLLQQVALYQPDVVITDLMMPQFNGIQAIQEIKNTHPEIKCIAISTYESTYLIIDALEAGALGYLVKNAQREEFTDAITAVYNDHPYYCKTTTLKLARQIAKSSFNPYRKQDSEWLTLEEIEVIKRICQEKTTEEIGKELFVGTRTIERMRSKILEKTNSKTAAGLAIYAIKNGIIPLDFLV